MGVMWTEQQQKVIDLRDRNILVSAAAGSGKTAVLVERIIQMLTDEKHPVDVDELLIVTFTEAAAGEMKERIRAAIENALEENPEHEHLKRQATLIHNAQITTIHSFCLSVIRDHFHAIDIDPVAARVAAENAELNGIDMSGYFIRIGDILSDEKFRDDISGRQYDIVLANIVANVIIAFAPVIPQLMKPGGKLIASGIIADRLDEVLDALKANGLEAVEICSGEDWRAVLAAKIS